MRDTVVPWWWFVDGWALYERVRTKEQVHKIRIVSSPCEAVCKSPDKSKPGSTSHLTYSKSFRRAVFSGNWLHWYWQPELQEEVQLPLTNRPTLVHADIEILTKKRYQAQLSMLCCQKLPFSKWLQFIGRIFRLLPIIFPFVALSEGIPSSYRVYIWYGKTRMAALQSGEDHTMIDSVVWAQYINVTYTQTATSP